VAEVVRIGGVNAKLRHPWVVFLLVLVTLGIYYLVWYYKTNRELAEYGVGDSPGLSLVAITLGGFLFIPPFVSEWRYYRRIGEAQARAGMDHRISHVTGFVLYLIALVLLPFEAVYAQHHLNRLWRHLVEEAQKTRLGMRG
jgi:Zn-dependent protease